MPGDKFPKELLTGEASWEVTEEHKAVARQRVCMQLVSWMSGDENLITDPQQLIQIAEDPQMKQKVNKAFDEAAAALDNPNANKDMVVDLIEELAGELAYIETLREQFRNVVSAEEKIKRIRHGAAKQRSLLDNANSVAKLISVAVKEFQSEFDMADGQTGEIIGVLKNIHSQKEYIRGVRDSLYRRLVAWDDLLRAWERQTGMIVADTADLLRDTYRFLAPRYMQTDDWLLASQIQEKQLVDIEAKGARW
jgi:DNA mismatch repair ATPase MutS